MTLGSPRDAAPRMDLPYLRHRGRPATATADTGRWTRRAAPASLDLDTVALGPTNHRRLAPARRTTPNGPISLFAQSPTVVLTRIQSGVGTLTTTVHWPQPTGGRLVVAYQKANGDHRLFTPQDGRLVTADCLVLDHRTPIPMLQIDLLHVRSLSRLLLAVAHHGTRPGPLTGVLIVHTHGGARIDRPFSLPAMPGVGALATAHNVNGELVLRAEWDPACGSLQSVCTAYGYDRITWLDPSTPLR